MMPIPPQPNLARALWTNTGRQRPAFAVQPSANQESVWDYPRPPALRPDSREVVVSYKGREIARTNRAIRVCETASPPTFYLPIEDVAVAHLQQAAERTVCEWKGQAVYWDLVVPGVPRQSHVAWSYPNPRAAFRAIAGCFAFYPSRLDCQVDGQLVVPQPGDFYGGWITPEVVGPFKGDPGTLGW